MTLQRTGTAEIYDAVRTAKEQVGAADAALIDAHHGPMFEAPAAIEAAQHHVAAAYTALAYALEELER
jgi:hypothetical protein